MLALRKGMRAASSANCINHCLHHLSDRTQKSAQQLSDLGVFSSRHHLLHSALPFQRYRLLCELITAVHFICRFLGHFLYVWTSFNTMFQRWPSALRVNRLFICCLLRITMHAISVMSLFPGQGHAVISVLIFKNFLWRV